MKLVVHGLIERRAKMVGEIAATQECLGRLLADLDHLDATIHIFKPDIDLEDFPMKRVPPPNAAFRGEVQRFLLHTLRTASAPMTTLQLATAVMEPGTEQCRQGASPPDCAAHRTLARQAPQEWVRAVREG